MFWKFRLQIRTLWQNWRGNSSRRIIRVDFYTRAGCCLCDDALKILVSARRRYSIDLQEIDVDSAPGLVQEFGDRVPVVVINGRERFHGQVNRVLLERLFSAESAQG
jgi:glutaredoxin